jgi:hypothetical protein
VPLLGGGILLLGAAIALVWYLGTPQDDRVRPPDPTSPVRPDHDKQLETKLKDREDDLARLDTLMRRTADRLPGERYAPECPALKEYLAKVYEEYRDAITAVNMLRGQLGQDTVASRPRPDQLDLTCENAKQPTSPTSSPSPKQKAPPPATPSKPPPSSISGIPAEISSLLNRFKRAYERRDLEALQSLSRMSESRLQNIEFMFSNYSAFTTTIQDVTATKDGGTAILILETGTRDSGVIPIPDRARAVTLRIIREENNWLVEW